MARGEEQPAYKLTDDLVREIRAARRAAARADELARLISRPGFEASRTDAFRAAVARGFDVMLEELGGGDSPRPSKKRT